MPAPSGSGRAGAQEQRARGDRQPRAGRGTARTADAALGQAARDARAAVVGTACGRSGGVRRQVDGQNVTQEGTPQDGTHARRHAPRGGWQAGMVRGQAGLDGGARVGQRAAGGGRTPTGSRTAVRAAVATSAATASPDRVAAGLEAGRPHIRVAHARRHGVGLAGGRHAGPQRPATAAAGVVNIKRRHGWLGRRTECRRARTRSQHTPGSRAGCTTWCDVGWFASNHRRQGATCHRRDAGRLHDAAVTGKAGRGCTHTGPRGQGGGDLLGDGQSAQPQRG